MRFTDSEVFFKKAILKNFSILNSGFKRLQHRCFPVNIAKFFKTTILKNFYEPLLLKSEEIKNETTENRCSVKKVSNIY